MQTSPDCLPCFLRQALHVATMTDCKPAKMEEILQAAEIHIRSFDLTLSPPENAVAMYELLAHRTGVKDPFAAIKKTSNLNALAILPRLRQVINGSADPLMTAARLAVAGNIIDYGSQQKFDVEAAIADSMRCTPAVDHFAWLRERLSWAKHILYLADNCGELVFDRLFIEQIKQPVTLAVKSGPIINDATLIDAEECGLTGLCRVVDNGSSCPGTPLGNCTPEFQSLFLESDLIISKGQGNFETLSETVAPLFFMLLVKCRVVAMHASEKAVRPPGAIKTGDMLMLAQEEL